MHEGPNTELSQEAAEHALREDLARADAALAAAVPVLSHFLANDEPELFSEEVVARVRGMLGHVARQLLETHANGAGPPADTTADDDALIQRLSGDAALLTHAHALALEGQLLERLQQHGAIDPVLPPLIADLAAHPEGRTAELAMQVLAAQARFMQHYHRMELPLGELPAELFHAAMMQLGDDAAAQPVRDAYAEADGRQSLLTRLAMELDGHVGLVLQSAGASIFATALALATDRPRELTLTSLATRNAARLAILLRAAGLEPAEVEAQLAPLHPDLAVPAGLASLDAARAAAMLSPVPLAEAS